MTKRKSIFLSLSAVFVLVEILLSFLIQTTAQSNIIQFLSVALACLFCILFAEKSSSYLFTQIALTFTVLADFFLVLQALNPQNQILGMLCFSVTQLAYFLRLYFEDENKKRRKIHLIVRVLASLIILLATYIVLGSNADALAFVSMNYYVNLALNIVFSFIQLKNSSVLAIGLVCFIICDTFIGLSNISPYISAESNAIIQSLINSKYNIAWVFYVPSQTLLAISLLPSKLKKRV